MMPNDQMLIDRIYEAAVIPDMWSSILDDLSEITRCYGGTLFSMDAQQIVRHTVTEQYREVMDIFVRGGWNKHNIRAQRLTKLKYTGFITDLDLIDLEEMNNHPFYTELLRPNGGGWAIGTIIAIPSGDLLVFNLERRYAEGPIERSLCSRLDALRPHLARAGLLSVRLRMERARAMVDALEQINLPSAVVREDGHVLAMNSLLGTFHAQIAVGAFDEISIKHAPANGILKRSLEEIRGGQLDRGVRSIPIPAAQDQPALILHLVPITGGANDIFSRAVAILVVTPLLAPTAPSEDVLNGLFDLSPAEVKVAQQIVIGKTIESVSADLNLSRETVRNQLKSVFAKTGTHRQAELVGLLARAAIPTMENEAGIYGG